MIGMLFVLVFAVAIVCVLGFVLSFVHNLFEQEELPVGRGILIIFLSIVASMIVGVGLNGSDMDEGMVSLVSSLVNFLILTALIKLLAYTSWVKAALISLVFTVVIFVASFALAMFLTPGAAA